MRERVAVYPGSFDPPTNGHLDLIQRASALFDRLIVAVATNTDKQGLFPVDERLEMLTAITRDIPNVQVASFVGLTAEFARECNAVAVVRGLRVMSDFEFELTMAITNQKLNPSLETVCLMPSEPHLFLSSRIVREIARFNGDLSELVPPQIEPAIRKRCRNGV
ncbi:MAG TPA: pantetheine-phosphate adenylyltransferase [Candidatus Hydrogenedentes bacterium]|nr:pantetheine-phosphate adenylyltransferase [Candidatus Hydrogenedentota bacterium]HQE82223.1 pantetheine-phosphate adenylyltransferase [Candidatus Hydrogenedentota bacterium]HQH53661.1 pantetheine-phosphate adenylyltransferase [Candidatus Hydrogenedentota bacterium]HQM48519.1 pantetheine-phosphate adenylyltransferase [Candidatus Hydrogenedentota bacterium]